MVKPIRKYQQIPTQLAKYIVHNDLWKPFQIYMYFKCCSNGIITKKSEAYLNIMNDLNIKDDRTFKKHFQILLKLNWVGYNHKTKNYFFRSIDIIRIKHNFIQRQSATFHFEYINNMREFLCAIIINSKIIGQKYFFEVGQKRKTKTAVNTLVTALQVASSSSSTQKWVVRRQINDKASKNIKKLDFEKPEYYGLSLWKIAEILKCKKTTACEIKQRMEEAGFIKIIHHEKVIDTLQNRDYTYRDNFHIGYPDLAGRLSFRTRKIELRSVDENNEANNKVLSVIDVVLILHDEILPSMSFKKVAKFSSIIFKAA